MKGCKKKRTGHPKIQYRIEKKRGQGLRAEAKRKRWIGNKLPQDALNPAQQGIFPLLHLKKKRLALDLVCDL